MTRATTLSEKPLSAVRGRFRSETLLGLALLALAFPRTSLAFPEMVRFGYTNCTSCHYDPNGSGVLTPYGRELSQAVLSTWGTEKEAKFAYGAVNLPSWVDAMGMYRSVYAYEDTPYVQQGEYIFMQGDGEVNFHTDHWYVDGTVGYKNPPGANGAWSHVDAPRYYVNYRPTDEWSFRFGKDYPAYGILTANHVIPTRKNLGWDEGQETDLFEAAYLGDTWNVYATAILGQLDLPSQTRETGFALRPSISIADRYKAGMSYYYGDSQTSTRNLFGPWGMLGFSEQLFLLSEWDFQQQSYKNNLGPSTWGAVNYQKLGYQVVQGVIVYATQDYSRLSFADLNTLQNSFGLGAQWFPRPHMEINLSWQKLRNLEIAPDYTDFAWIMFNYYL